MPEPRSPRSLRFLLVEDEPLDAALLLSILERAGYDLKQTERVETRADFLEMLAKPWDIVLCDYNLPSFGAREVLALIRERGLDLPVIIISGYIGEEIAVELIKGGAADYLLKDRLGRLGVAIASALEQQALRAAARRAEEDLRDSEFKYRCLFDHLLDAAFVCEAGTLRIIDTNRQGERWSGRERASLLGTRLDDFLPEEDAGRLRALAKAGAAEVTFLTRIAGAPEGRSAVQVAATPVTIHHHPLLLVLFRRRDD